MTFKELAQYFQKLEQTPSRTAMTEILADLFRHAPKDEIGKICYLLQGRVVPLYEAVEFGMADKFVIRAMAQAYGVENEEVTKVYKSTGDVGEAAERIATQKGTKAKGNLSVSEVFTRLMDIAKTGGEGSQEKKITLLCTILLDMDPLSARYLVRIPLDKLRLGFSDMTILDGLSWMLSGDKSLRSKLEEAYNLRPDIGYLAEKVKAEGIAGVSHVRMKVGAPILAALCQRLPTADEMIEKMGTVDVEPKFDGVRVQIHYEKTSDIRHQTSADLKAESGKLKASVQSYSRNLENTTAMFPELEKIGSQIKGREVVLDSEAVGMDPKTGKLIPFQTTMTRKRKHGIEEAVSNVPLKFFVFDILYKDGKELLSTPLSKRREILEQTITKGDLLVISPQIVTDSAQTIREYHDEQLKKGLEGAVVKKWESPYEPGRRGYSWVKFKEEEGKTGKLKDTIDAVVMGYYLGEGKRAGFGIGAFLVGVRKGDTFVTVTKIGTGVSDEQWKSLQKDLEGLKMKEQPKEYAEVNKVYTPDVWVEPKLVVEIAGDDLTKSPTHGAGYAVRFPRLVKIRDDRRPQDATTVKEVEEMFRNQ